MPSTDSNQDSSVESEDNHGVPPTVLAESIRSKTNALHAQGEDLAEQLERLAAAEEGEGGEGDTDGEDGGDGNGGDEVEVDTAAMMTELLETASDLIEVAHQIESARLRDRSE